jgi:hypothetical protein
MVKGFWGLEAGRIRGVQIDGFVPHFRQEDEARGGCARREVEEMPDLL